MALRQRIVRARTVDHQSMGLIALRFDIPKGTVQNILERYRDTGSQSDAAQHLRPNALSNDFVKG